MNIILCTSQDIGPKLVKTFSELPQVNLLVLTQETERDRMYGYQSTPKYCKEHNIHYKEPRHIDNKVIKEIKKWKPDIIVCAYYPKIFSKEFLEIPPLGVINVHPGDLPKYRGKFSIPWAILNGEEYITATVHYLDEGIDSGDIICKEKFRILENETGHQLYKRAMHKCSDLIVDAFKLIKERRVSRKAQQGYGSYYSNLETRCQIDWQESACHIQRKIRVHAKPYLPAYTYRANKCFYINRVSIVSDQKRTANSTGKILKVFDDKSFTVSCADGILKVNEYEISPNTSRDSLKYLIYEGAKFEN